MLAAALYIFERQRTNLPMHIEQYPSICSPSPIWGSWHDSELPILFGTFNGSTATTAEVELSQSLQTLFANFAKNPVNVSPAPNWHPHEPGYLGIASIPTLDKSVYQGIVGPDDSINPVQTISTDGPCVVWDAFLDSPPLTFAGNYSRGMSMVNNQVGDRIRTFPNASLIRIDFGLR
ncbi:hypothetical protein DFH94DRAFT_318009 [Russula ochroleuca]|uniref:Carboxylesterase type B domain-containing protein n=1 Tax=Russula ochroleuca TaxID=152965 RepID=A0A9P5TBY9_9AGAM|nr:hypothetical protein DFH94DRAFT_318009 [Russula ochroleuca]